DSQHIRALRPRKASEASYRPIAVVDGQRYGPECVVCSTSRCAMRRLTHFLTPKAMLSGANKDHQIARESSAITAIVLILLVIVPEAMESQNPLGHVIAWRLIVTKDHLAIRQRRSRALSEPPVFMVELDNSFWD